ncbi:MAG: DNA-binding protein [Armatimonadota bacterium]
MRLVAVFGSARCAPQTPQYLEAYAWGRAVARAGFGVVTGGYNGSMEAVSHGAKEAGGLVVGVTAPPLFPTRKGPNDHVDLEIPAPTLLTRIERLLDVAVGYLVLPGGVGTLTELMAAWNVAVIAQMHGLPYRPIGVHAGWMELLRPQLEIAPAHLELLSVLGGLEDVEAFLSGLLR